MLLHHIPRCPVDKFSIMPSLILLLFFVMYIPQSAIAGYTYLNVYANDYCDPSETFSETIENKISASASVGFDLRDGYYGYPMLASSKARYNLNTGEIGFYFDSMGYQASSGANVQLEDTIYPVWDNGSTGAMDIQITWTMSGDYTVYGWSYTEDDWVIGGSPVNLSLTSRFYYSLDGASEYSPYSQYNLTDGYETWTRTISFDPATNDYLTIGELAYGSFSTYNSQYAVADFSNTGFIEIILPVGASYTSDSGVFLTGSGGDVIPAPSAVLLASIGVGLVRCLRRRRVF